MEEDKSYIDRIREMEEIIKEKDEKISELERYLKDEEMATQKVKIKNDLLEAMIKGITDYW